MNEIDLPQGEEVQKYIQKHFQGFKFVDPIDLKQNLGFVPCLLQDIEAGFEYSLEIDSKDEIAQICLTYHTEEDLRCAQLVAKSLQDLSGSKVRVEPSYDQIFKEISGIYESLLREVSLPSEYEKRRDYINSKYEDYDLAEAHATETLDGVIESKISSVAKKGNFLSINFTTGDFVVCKSWSITNDDLNAIEGLAVTSMSQVKSNLVIKVQGGQTLICQRYSENMAVKTYPAIYSSKHDAYFHLAWNGVHASAEY
jgi:hypothetical protein